MCLERWKWSATALTTFGLCMCRQGNPFPVDARADRMSRAQSRLLRGGALSPPLRTSTFTKHATTTSPLTLPPPSPPFLLSFLLSSMRPLGLLRPSHVALPHQCPSTTTVPVCVPCRPPAECHINHHEPPPLLCGLSPVALKMPPCCTNRIDRSTTDGTSPCM
jgi:hypothetical protein